MTGTTPFLHIPQTVSRQAQEYMRGLSDPALAPDWPEAGDIQGWIRFQEAAEWSGLARSAVHCAAHPHRVSEDVLAGTRALIVTPGHLAPGADGPLIIYVHAGAHVMFSAASTLGRAVLLAQAARLPVVSVDYTLAPHARYGRMSDEIANAIEALLRRGYGLDALAVYGDSSGGGLAAATVLKLRDRGVGLPAAVSLSSPWLDVTASGDTETTLRHAEANAVYEKHLGRAAAAFADAADQRHPYASPVYADLARGFAPTLIQGGLKETLLSGMVRFHQKLQDAGVPCELDLYEGMVHNFQERIPDSPEGRRAWSRIGSFLRRRFGLPVA